MQTRRPARPPEGGRRRPLLTGGPRIPRGPGTFARAGDEQGYEMRSTEDEVNVMPQTDVATPGSEGFDPGDWKSRIIAGRALGAAANPPAWLDAAYATLREQVMHPEYPCFFGTMAEKRGEMFYGYVNGKDIAELPATMQTFLGAGVAPGVSQEQHRDLLRARRRTALARDLPPALLADPAAPARRRSRSQGRPAAAALGRRLGVLVRGRGDLRGVAPARRSARATAATSAPAWCCCSSRAACSSTPSPTR